MRHFKTHARWRRGTAVFATTAVVSAGLVTGAAAPALAAPPAPDLHYTMDDVSGSTVPDSSGNDWNGTISGAIAVIDGAEGSAIDLQGGRVTLPREVLDGATDLTVSTRVQWSGDGGNWQWIFGLGSDTTRYLFASPSNGDGDFRAAITRSGGGAAEATITGAGALPADDWTTLTLTLDTDADLLTAYVNGVVLGSVATDIAAGELLTAQAENAGAIGASFYPDPAFDGAVDDFRIYRDALTTEEVAQLFGGDLPEVVELTETVFPLRTRVGEAPLLPATVRASYTDAVTREVPIEWDAVDPERYGQTGTFTVTGMAAGIPVSADVVVHRGEVRIDLGTDTGDVYGGAAGALYGLYGEGMPTSNLVEGMNLRTVATKAQDGSQHPGSDALEILPTMAEADGDVYLRVTDYYRGFPYQVPGDTPAERRTDYARVLAEQLDMIEQYAAADEAQRAQVADHLVIEPFNEPEGNNFSDRGNAQWPLGPQWLNEPGPFFDTWDQTYRTIREWSERTGIDLRIAGPGSEHLWTQVRGFLEHTVDAGTVPDIVTWHELTHPQAIRDSVATFRQWESEVFDGTSFEGTELPLNINEYAFNYHTSVPGQMIQWISAIEDTKVDAMIAFWNINGNLSDSAVQQNRGNGQWWLFNAYSQMSGHTVEVTPPSPGENYTLQGLASLDDQRRIARAIIGGADGSAPVEFVNVPGDVFGTEARVQVRKIAWTGQIGDSAQPSVIHDTVVPVIDGTVAVEFGADMPELEESSAYEIVLTPGENAQADGVDARWSAAYEAEDAEYEGSGYSRNGPEGSPADVGKFYTSGGYNVGGLRTGSDGTLKFHVEVPEDGQYDLSVFANSLNTFDRVAENGPTNVFLTVDGAAEQELFLPLGYKWVVWDHTDTTVELSEGVNQIALSARSLDGSGATQGDALIDRIALTRSAAADAVTVYEAELTDHDGAASYDGSGVVALEGDQSATFWVYGARDAEASLSVVGSGSGSVSVNGHDVLDLAESTSAAVHLMGGINKVVVTGDALVDALHVGASEGVLDAEEYQAEDARTTGEAAVTELSRAEGGLVVAGIGGEPG
ncbi:LamG-like jellyroll fold domain-containing protein, partial [Microbacterium sp.]|uniref:LamG-like jellyroll fold domain-containing protein n=1 Tax=Microbacterium sp. TaxID=51671 RepID=UPI00273663D3